MIAAAVADGSCANKSTQQFHDTAPDVQEPLAIPCSPKDLYSPLLVLRVHHMLMDGIILTS
jgi:hypothetical protein